MKRLFLILGIIISIFSITGAQTSDSALVVEMVPAEASPPPPVISTEEAPAVESAAGVDVPVATTEPVLVPPVEATADASTASVVPETVAPVVKALPLAPGPAGPGWKDLDFSSSLISLAGPSSLYIRDVKWNGKLFALLAQTEDKKTWKVADSWEMSDGSPLPARALFDLATLTLKDGNTLVLDGVMVDGSAVKSTLSIQEDGSLVLAPAFEPGSVVGASLSRSALLGKAANAETALGTERLRNEDLARIGNLESELKTARTDLADLKARNQTLQAEVETLRTEVARLQALQLEAQMAGKEPVAETAGLGEFQSRLASLEARVLGLETGIAKAAASPATVSTANIDALKAENDKLTAERQSIETNLRMAFIKSGYIATMRPLFTQVVHRGFAGGVKEIGTWTLSGNSLLQSNPREHFSRYTLPLAQKGQAMLYKFTMQSTGAGWVGAGLHFFASNSPKRGYGHGESLLVWLTRSEPHEKNRGKGTWLQLYKSSTDVIMDRVLDAAIEESMAKELEVEILYQPAEEYITIAVNGVEKIRYKTWFGVNQGLEMAFRTLDTARFKDFEVRAMGADVAAPSKR